MEDGKNEDLFKDDGCEILNMSRLWDYFNYKMTYLLVNKLIYSKMKKMKFEASLMSKYRYYLILKYRNKVVWAAY